MRAASAAAWGSSSMGQQQQMVNSGKQFRPQSTAAGNMRHGCFGVVVKGGGGRSYAGHQCVHACRHLVQCIGERVDCCADRLALCVECRGAARCSDSILKSRQRLQHLAQQTCVTQRDCHATARQRMTHIECVTQQQRACAYQGAEVCELLKWVPQMQSCVRFVLQQGLGSQAAGE
jgi:hypothetical protein